MKLKDTEASQCTPENIADYMKKQGYLIQGILVCKDLATCSPELLMSLVSCDDLDVDDQGDPCAIRHFSPPNEPLTLLLFFFFVR